MCMIEACDSYTTALDLGERKARKDHRCNECYRTINKGELYEYFYGIGEGGLFTNKTCSHCQVAVSWLNAECDGYVFESVREDILEHVREGIYGYDLARLYVGMRRRWQKKNGELMPIPARPKGSITTSNNPTPH